MCRHPLDYVPLVVTPWESLYTVDTEHLNMPSLGPLTVLFAVPL